MVKASLAGLAGLSLPRLLQARQEAGASRRKAVLLLWMAGGPSHLDTWDPKPDAPPEIRGPFGVTRTRLPGVVICEHLPKTAAMLDQFTVLRSVDARHSGHEPNTVFQTGNSAAEPRVNREARLYPAIGSIVARHRGPSPSGIPPYVAFMRSRSHLAFGGYLGQRYDPFLANDAARLPVYTLRGEDTGTMTEGKLFQLPRGLTLERLEDRRSLLRDLDGIRRDLDASGQMEALDAYGQQAADLLLGRRAQEAFDLSREPQRVRDRYGKHLWCQQALLARRLLEAGVSFVTLDLSYHTASGDWDTHGDDVPPYGGIKSGLGPLLPLFDHLLTTVVGDLKERGLLDDVLVLAMGEFGRSPRMTKGGGRDHWPEVMSMVMAGGGLRHGQVIGASTRDGGRIRERPVTPGDLAATLYHHLGVPLDQTYTDFSGRPRMIVEEGQPIRELL
jgi:hypothetical protein